MNSHTTNPKLVSLYLILILIITTLIYSPVYNFEFLNFDDNIFVVNNPQVNTGLNVDNLKWAFAQPYAGQWQPITWISHMLDVEIYEMWPGGHHLTNVIIHTASIVILFLIILKLGSGYLIAFLLAMFWGLHPLRLESVAWISERKDVASVFFGLLTILVYLHSQKSRFYRIFFVTIFYILGLMCKPIIITVPILLVIIDLIIYKKDWKTIFKSVILEKSPLLGFAVLSAVIAIFAQQIDRSLNSLDLISFGNRLELAGTALTAYFAKFICPTGGGIFYPLVDYPPGVGAGAILSLLVLSYICIRNYKNHPHLSFGFFWMLVSTLPIIGIVHIGGQSLADRWTYFSHLGLTIALALYFIKDNNGRVWRISILALFTIIFALITWNRLPNWRNNQTIYQYTLEISPNNFMAHTNLGAAFDAEGRLDLAAPHFEEAARLNPTYPEALNNLGSLRARQGKLGEAIELFEQALAIRPDFVSAKQNLLLARGS